MAYIGIEYIYYMSTTHDKINLMHNEKNVYIISTINKLQNFKTR